MIYLNIWGIDKLLIYSFSKQIFRTDSFFRRPILTNRKSALCVNPLLTKQEGIPFIGSFIKFKSYTATVVLPYGQIDDILKMVNPIYCTPQSVVIFNIAKTCHLLNKCEEERGDLFSWCGSVWLVSCCFCHWRRLFDYCICALHDNRYGGNKHYQNIFFLIFHSNLKVHIENY